jgi:3-oxoacyl-[acyl-carrier protein] reductase
MAGFDGFTVLVTGAASGLGAATATRLAAEGAQLILSCHTNRQGAEVTCDRCRSAGAQARLVQGDVADDGDCRRIAATAAEWGRLDVLINCAGATKQAAHSDLEALSEEDFGRLYAINAVGPFQMVRATRALLETGARASGRASAVVNISSVSAFDGSGSSVAYTASKAALNSITLSLARALAPLIRVNAVCPGYMDTPWWPKASGAEAADKLRDGVRALVPLKVASTADDLADIVTFLAGPASRNMTGELLIADAGLRLAGR